MSDHSNAPALPAQDDNQLIAERREKLKALRQQQAQGGGVAFPNDFQPAHRASAGSSDMPTYSPRRHSSAMSS